MTHRTLVFAAATLLGLVGAACSSDGDTTTDTSSDIEAPGNEPPSDEEVATAEQCVEILFEILDEADFSDEEAVADEVNSTLDAECATADQMALGEELDSRLDELSDEAFEFIRGVARVDGQDCVALSEELPAGAPDVPVPVGPPPTELIVEDIAAGDGDVVAPGDEVTVDYIGVACSSGVIFDNSYERGEPATFGLDAVIPGWSDGLVGMAVGGTRLLVVPPDQGYGDRGSPPDIGGGETLVFVVELRSIT